MEFGEVTRSLSPSDSLPSAQHQTMNNVKTDFAVFGMELAVIRFALWWVLSGLSLQLRGLEYYVRALIYLVRYRSIVIEPYVGQLCILALFSLLFYYPFKAYVVEREVEWINGWLPSFLSIGARSARFLRWSQTRLILKMVIKPLRAEWRRDMKAVVVRSEGLDQLGVDFKPSKPRHGEDPEGKLSKGVKLMWYQFRVSGILVKTFMPISSTIVNCLPYIGPILYLYWQGGIKARAVTMACSVTEPSWTRLQRLRWTNKKWNEVRSICMLQQLTDMIPGFGVFASLVSDVAITLWMSDQKAQIRLENCKLEDLHPMPYMSADHVQTGNLMDGGVTETSTMLKERPAGSPASWETRDESCAD